MRRDTAVMNTLTVFTYLTTYYPKELVNLTQYCDEMKLTFHCSNMTEQEIEDLSKQIDNLRIDGTKMKSNSHVSHLDRSIIKTLELSWNYYE